MTISEQLRRNLALAWVGNNCVRKKQWAKTEHPAVDDRSTALRHSRLLRLPGKPVPGHGVYRLHDNLPRDEVLIGKHLQDRGYRTGLIGKLHVSGRVTEADVRHPNDGFDVYEWCHDPAIHLDSKYNAYAAWLKDNHPAFLKKLLTDKRNVLHHPVEAHFNHWAADRTISFLEQHAGGVPQQDRPFFCFMSISSQKKRASPTPGSKSWTSATATTHQSPISISSLAAC